MKELDWRDGLLCTKKEWHLDEMFKESKVVHVITNIYNPALLTEAVGAGGYMYRKEEK